MIEFFFQINSFYLVIGCIFAVVIIFKPFLGLLAIAFMMPLESILVFSSGITAIKILGITTFSSFALHCIIKKERILIDRNVMIPMILFILWAGLRGAGNLERVITLFQLCLLFIMTTSLCVNNKRRTDLLVWALIIGCFISLFIAIPMYLTKPEFGTRASAGEEQDPNKYAIIIGICFLILLMHKSWLNLRKALPIRFTILALFIYGLIICASRGAIVAMTCTMIIYFIVNKKRLKSIFYISLIGLLATTTLIIGLQEGMIRKFSVERIETVKSDESAGGRIYILRTGLKMVIDNPIIGVGLNEFKKNFGIYARMRSFGRGFGPHNTFLSILAETGIVGFGLALWIGAALGTLLKRSKSETAILSLCMLSFLTVASLSITTHFMKIFWTCLSLSYLFVYYPLQNTLLKDHMGDGKSLVCGEAKY